MGDRSSCHLTFPSFGIEGVGTRAPGCQENGGTKGTCASGSVGGGLVSGVAQLPWPVRSQGVGKGRESGHCFFSRVVMVTSCLAALAMS